MLSYAKAVEADSMELQMSQDEQPRQGTIRQAFSWTSSILPSFHPSALIVALLSSAASAASWFFTDDRPSLEQRPPDLHGLRKAPRAVHAARDFCETSTIVHMCDWYDWFRIFESQLIVNSFRHFIQSISYMVWLLGTNGPTRRVTFPKWSKVMVAFF